MLATHLFLINFLSKAMKIIANLGADLFQINQLLIAAVLG
jgi:hypothetical protein